MSYDASFYINNGDYVKYFKMYSFKSYQEIRERNKLL